MPTAHIASIYFGAVRAERSSYSGYYDIAAVPRGDEPKILELTDKIQRDEGPYITGPSRSQRQKLQYIITGEEIGRDLVANWTQHGLGMTPACHPGIWLVRERLPMQSETGGILLDAIGVPVWRAATTEERSEMWEEDLLAARVADAAYAEYLVLKADEIDALEPNDPRKFPGVSALMKAAAKQYGVERKWLRTLTSSETLTCPYCTTVVNARAVVCPSCQRVIDVERFAKLQALEAEAVRTAKQNRQQLQQSPAA